MELGAINTILKTCGWLSVIMGVISLALINITILSGYDLPFANAISVWVIPAVFLGFVSLFNKKSRSLGIWGLGLTLFIGLFVAVIFFIGWSIVPFP